jgi:hypothetical protein
MELNYLLFNSRFVPANRRRKPVALRHYRVLCNGQPLGELDAASPVRALDALAPERLRGPIRRIADIGAVMECGGQHYQAQEA